METIVTSIKYGILLTSNINTQTGPNLNYIADADWLTQNMTATVFWSISAHFTPPDHVIVCILLQAALNTSVLFLNKKERTQTFYSIKFHELILFHFDADGNFWWSNTTCWSEQSLLYKIHHTWNSGCLFWVIISIISSTKVKKKRKNTNNNKKNLYATKSLLCKADKMGTVFKQQHH